MLQKPSLLFITALAGLRRENAVQSFSEPDTSKDKLAISHRQIGCDIGLINAFDMIGDVGNVCEFCRVVTGQTYMRGLVEEGHLRIQPASFYSGGSHSQAVRDDELTVPVSFSLPRDVITKLVSNPSDVPAIVPAQRLDVEFRSPTDFWLYCVTQSVDPRLIVDFSAEACVVIRDRREFAKRLRSAAQTALAGVEARDGSAIYVDPLLPKTAKVFVPQSKPFGYTYQDEYRFFWLPRNQGTALKTVDLVLGPLTDIADLVVL